MNMKYSHCLFWLPGLLISWWATAGIQPAPPDAVQLPGQQADGSVLLPNQWSLRPAGRQVLVGDFPVNIALHPGNRYAAVLHAGYGRHEVIILDLPGARIICRAALDEAFYGLRFNQAGTQLFCSGASNEAVFRFDFAGGYLSHPEEIRLRPVGERGIPAGLAVHPDGKTLFAANLRKHSVSIVQTSEPGTVREIPLAMVPWSVPARLAKPSENEDLAAIAKRDEASLDQSLPTDPFPYDCQVDPARNRLYVSQWGQASVAVIDLDRGQVASQWPVQEHPNEMLLASAGKLLYVANANRNTVTAIETATGQVLETISSAMYPDSPPGSTPNSLALSPDEKLLFIANACNNNLAVFEVSQPGQSRSLGFIPVGWYPTSVRVSADGKYLVVANGKGLISKANRHGPQPGKDPPASVREYIGGLLQGTVSVITLPKLETFEKQLKIYTAQAYACCPRTSESALVAIREKDNPIPLKVGGPSPIKYCLYIIKENRTYDQVFGDLKMGNGDPSLCLFPEHVTPNHHQLARQFVLLDNFYVESEVSADGHEWSMGAYATDFVEKTWPLSYGHNSRGKYSYPSEGNYAIATPAGGYLWDRAKAAGISYRSYGEFVSNGKTPSDPGTIKAPALKGHFDPWFRSFDMEYPDVKRAARFVAELKRFEQEGEMPRLQIVRLPNDHTSGTSAGKLTPTAQVADNDQALGTVIEAISHSKFWPQTAVFVVEDDAQNGPDHVDAHRTVALVISPYVKRAVVDSTLYSTASMLRTMELILGLKPMSQFDAAALPMFHSFTATRNLEPYTALPVQADLNERNTKTAWGSQLSETMNFAQEDAADDLLLNEVIWRSVKGIESPMPPPTRAAFVFARPEKKSGDDD